MDEGDEVMMLCLALEEEERVARRFWVNAIRGQHAQQLKNLRKP
jgi:hypothetical protein